MDKYLDRKRKTSSCVSGNSSEADDDASTSPDNQPPSTKKTCPPKRKYYESYLNFGFISTDTGDAPRPQRVIFMEILVNASMKPSKLARHQETKHRDTLGKSAEFFKHKRTGLKK